MAIRDPVDLSDDQHAPHDPLRAILSDQLSSAELRTAQFGGGELAGEDGPQGVLLGRLVLADVDRILNRHESRSPRPAVSCSQTSRSHSG